MSINKMRSPTGLNSWTSFFHSVFNDIPKLNANTNLNLDKTRLALSLAETKTVKFTKRNKKTQNFSIKMKEDIEQNSVIKYLGFCISIKKLKSKITLKMLIRS